MYLFQLSNYFTGHFIKFLNILLSQRILIYLIKLKIETKIQNKRGVLYKMNRTKIKNFIKIANINHHTH